MVIVKKGVLSSERVLVSFSVVKGGPTAVTRAVNPTCVTPALTRYLLRDQSGLSDPDAANWVYNVLHFL